MSLAVQSSKILSGFALATLLFACEEEAKKEVPAPKPISTVAPVAPPPTIASDLPESQRAKEEPGRTKEMGPTEPWG